MAKREYKRIGGRGARQRQFFTWNTLWLGADHLLQVENTGYTEEYKRFYFRDIQSITVQKDNRFLYWSLFFAGFIAFSLAFFIWVEAIEAKWFWGLFGGLFLLLLLINLAKGPSCRSKIKTAVQEEEVPALRRVWKTEKALTRVRELIAAAQGTMSAEETQARLSRGEVFTSASPMQATASMAQPPLVPPTLSGTPPAR